MKNKKHLILAALAVVLVLASSVGIAMAYFTTYATAKGGYVLHLGNQTEITEEYSNGKKTLQIANTAENGTRPVFVRAKVLASSVVKKLDFQAVNGWYPASGNPNFSGIDDSYYYYDRAIYGGGSSGQAVIVISLVDEESASSETEKTEFKDGDSYNVIVVYECVPAVFTTSGNPDFRTAWTTGKVTVINEGGNG